MKKIKPKRTRPKGVAKGAASAGRDLSCPFPVAEWSDVGLLRHLALCLTAQQELEDRLCQVQREEPHASVDFAIIALSNLAREASHGALMLCQHGLLLPVEMLARPIVEYVLRAHYCTVHPDYAFWLRHVDLERTFLELHVESMSPEDRKASFRQADFNRREYRHLSPEARKARGEKPYHAISTMEMIAEVGTPEDRRDYKRNSSLLHGDTYSAVVLHKTDNEAVNQTLVKAALNSIRLSYLISTRLVLDGDARRNVLANLRAMSERLIKIADRHGLIVRVVEPAAYVGEAATGESA